MRGYPQFSAYCSTKFAVRALNQSASQELAQHKILCNVYCPSPVDTNMWTVIDKSLSSAAGIPEGSVSNAKIAETPLGRLVVPEDVANLVSFFAGPDSTFMTGESILVTVSTSQWAVLMVGRRDSAVIARTRRFHAASQELRVQKSNQGRGQVAIAHTTRAPWYQSQNRNNTIFYEDEAVLQMCCSMQLCHGSLPVLTLLLSFLVLFSCCRLVYLGQLRSCLGFQIP